jgi:putative NADH-flavin reductase
VNSDVALAEKQIRFAIAGATGMVGGYALRYMLNLPSVGLVSAIVRRDLDASDAKLKKVLIRDFSNYSEIAGELSGQDAVVFCLGAIYLIIKSL